MKDVLDKDVAIALRAKARDRWRDELRGGRIDVSACCQARLLVEHLPDVSPDTYSVRCSQCGATMQEQEQDALAEEYGRRLGL